MDLTPYVDNLQEQLVVAAEAGGEQARVVAERLIAPLGAGVRLALLDALSSAADEITREMAPGSVELRLRQREPFFVVALPPCDHPADDFGDAASPPPPVAVQDGDEGATARINFRLPESLKVRIEEAAGQAGLSVNAWLVRAAAAVLGSGDRSRETTRRPAPGSQRFTGWVR